MGDETSASQRSENEPNFNSATGEWHCLFFEVSLGVPREGETADTGGNGKQYDNADN